MIYIETPCELVSQLDVDMPTRFNLRVRTYPHCQPISLFHHDEDGNPWWTRRRKRVSLFSSLLFLFLFLFFKTDRQFRDVMHVMINPPSCPRLLATAILQG